MKHLHSWTSSFRLLRTRLMMRLLIWLLRKALSHRMTRAYLSRALQKRLREGYGIRLESTALEIALSLLSLRLAQPLSSQELAQGLNLFPRLFTGAPSSRIQQTESESDSES